MAEPIRLVDQLNALRLAESCDEAGSLVDLPDDREEPFDTVMDSAG